MRKFTLYVAATTAGLITVAGAAASMLGVIHGVCSNMWYFCFAFAVLPAVWLAGKLLRLCDRLNDSRKKGDK